MATWQQQPPQMGFYPPPQGGQGYYPSQPGYPQQPGAYPAQASYGASGPAGMMGPGPVPYGAPPPMNPSAPYDATYNDDTLMAGETFGFDSQTIRHAFIRKVYGILMCQLLITMGFVMLFTFHLPSKVYVMQHPAMLFVAIAITFGILIAMVCCENIRRKSPTNYICLLVFTLAMSYMMGTTAARYDTDAVLMAIGIATVVCFSLSVFAFQTKWDFTLLSGILLVCIVVFTLFGIICIFIPGKILLLVYASVGVILFSFYLVYDTQLMMGGKHKYSLSPEEYIFAALNLYIDIVNIFMYILQIIGLTKE